MGGLGSGGWSRDEARQRVEDCLSFAVGDFRTVLSPAAGGTLTWRRDATVMGTAGFAVMEEAGALSLHLDYRLNGAEDISLRVPLEMTRPGFGGRRWWFSCPKCAEGSGSCICRPEADTSPAAGATT